MSNEVDYYNNFYKDLARIDRQGNQFSKIEAFVTDLKPGSKILDVGCGFGSVSGELIRRGHTVYGMEVNTEAVAELHKLGFKVLEQDITKPFNLNEKFDVILILDVLEHVFDPTAILHECRKVLAEGGSIIISVPLYFDLRDRVRILFTGRIVSYDNLVYGKPLYSKIRSFIYDHIRFFKPEDVIEMCSIANLKPVQTKYTALAGLNSFFWRLIANKYSVKLWPGLFAHSMVTRVVKSAEKK